MVVALGVFPYPETFNFSTLNRAKKKRDEEAKKRYEQARMAQLVIYCRKCSSPDIEYGLHPKCKSCGEVHPPLLHIARQRISIEPDDKDDMSDIFDAPPPPEPEPEPEEEPDEVPFILHRSYKKVARA